MDSVTYSLDTQGSLVSFLERTQSQCDRKESGPVEWQSYALLLWKCCFKDLKA